MQFPRFTSSDRDLNITYAYRAEVFLKHIKTTPNGYVVTEFLPDVPWAGIYNTISCAAMHHFREGRWLTDPAVLEDYARFWCTEGNPRLYSFPLADSVQSYADVTGNDRLAEELYPQMAEICRAWDDHRTESGMYRQDDDRDGMEYAISGAGIRPTINCYMAADMLALAKTARRIGRTDEAESFEKEAKSLIRAIQNELWNEEIGMYGVISDSGEKQNVREPVGYIPWIYGFAQNGRDGAFRYLLDESCFLAPYGIRTADASHPLYMDTPTPHECLWNGPVWPFASAQTLTAVIEYLHTAKQPVISAADFTKLLLTYAASQRDTDGTPFIDENMHPDTGIWLAREILRSRNRSDRERGHHYNHSTFIDLVMTGICGIRPSSEDTLLIHPLGTSLDAFSACDIHYHGHTLDIYWNKKEGLRVYKDGTECTRCPAGDTVEAEIEV
ncbi:MAG: hypothetical protein IJZ08_09290 [Clostridia bacterium]|nr:hypothetical protein [Clostridia bacterium]